MNRNSSTNWFEKNPVKSILIILLTLVFLFECFLHLLYWMGALPNNVIYMTTLEKTGYRQNINQIVYEDNIPRRAKGYATYTQRGILNQFIEFDENGMRIDAYQGSDGKNVIIGVFGDSYTDALQIGQLEVYSALTERELLAGGCRVDFRNYGLGATGTSVQYLRYKQLKKQGKKFDYLVVTMFLGNDILNNNKELDTLFYKLYTAYPYFDIQNGKLMRDDLVRSPGTKFFKSAKKFLRDYSHIANTLYNLWIINSAHGQIKAAEKKDEDQQARFENRPIRHYIYNNPSDEKWEKAWQLTEEILKEWHAETIMAGEKMLLVFLTESIQLAPDYNNPNGLDLDYPNRRLSLFAAENDIAFIDFLPYARKKVAENKIQYPYLSWEHDGHYSQLGHSLLSNVLFDYYKDRLMCTEDATNP